MTIQPNRTVRVTVRFEDVDTGETTEAITFNPIHLSRVSLDLDSPVTTVEGEDGHELGFRAATTATATLILRDVPRVEGRFWTSEQPTSTTDPEGTR